MAEFQSIESVGRQLEWLVVWKKFLLRMTTPKVTHVVLVTTMVVTFVVLSWLAVAGTCPDVLVWSPSAGRYVMAVTAKGESRDPAVIGKIQKYGRYETDYTR